MTDTDAPGPRHADRGVVGNRQLIAVQTFDIARLTTHPMPIVPDTFVAVSGHGPRGDSNGSGKTTFLAAVSLLLADPQWGLHTNNGRFAGGLLFKPASAGIDVTQRVSAAPNGFVIGVFAEKDDPEGTARTVWVRIASAAPYIQVRWSDGVQLVVTEDDYERGDEAARMWRSLRRNGTISARKFAEQCYGDAPRCLSYLDTALRPSVPSLLSHQLTEMSPTDIGNSLITLSGAKHHLSDEQRERAALIAQRRVLAESEAVDRDDRIAEESLLAEVRARDESRAALANGDRAWQVFLAKRYLEVLARDEQLAGQLTLLDEEESLITERIRSKERELGSLQEKKSFAGEARHARADWDRSVSSLREVCEQRAGLTAIRCQLSDRRPKLRTAACEWSGESIDAATSAKAAVESLHVAALVRVSSATAEVEATAAAIAAAENGLSGAAGELAGALVAAGCSAAPLFDVLSVDDESRARWEPRLWPWRDAVVVGAHSIDEARRVAVDYPGGVLVEADEEVVPSPRGIACRFTIGSFLRSLEQRWIPQEQTLWVHDTGQRTTVLGGFDQPVTGRQAIIAGLRADRDRAVAKLEVATAGRVAAAAELEIATMRHEAAVAAAELAALDEEDARLGIQLAGLEAEITKREVVQERCLQTWQAAKAAAEAHDHRVLLAQGELTAEQVNVKVPVQKAASVRKERIGLMVERWRVLWQGGKDDANYLLQGEPEFAERKAEYLRMATLHSVREAFRAQGLNTDGKEPPAELRESLVALEKFQEETGGAAVPTVTFADVTALLADRLSRMDAHDRRVLETIGEEQDKRARYVAGLRDEVTNGAARVENLQGMIGRSLEGILDRVKDAFNRLDLDNQGFGADLIVHGPPPNDDGVWRWEVTPRWRRSLRGGMVAYQEIANGAQVKVHAVQLVLAALLADVETEGRVLVLDELGNSLGDINRKDVLRMLRTVAEERRVTVLGTCQDSVLLDASEVCGELLWFNHDNESSALNRPTRAWGFDRESGRVELTAADLCAGRNR